MDALISAQAGIALLIQGSELASVHAAAPERVFPRRAEEVHLLFGEAADLQVLEDVDRAKVVQRLTQEVASAEALQLCLILLDPEFSPEIRREAANELNEVLAEAERYERLECVLYAHPLPSTADLTGALAHSEGRAPRVQDLLHHLADLQLLIAEVFRAWTALPDTLFTGTAERQRCRAVFVREGLFRKLVLNSRIGSGVEPFLGNAMLNLLRMESERLVGSLVHRVLNLAWMESERLRLAAGLVHDMVGESPRMKEVYRFLAQVAPTTSTVLLRGETGTGKELAARAIHDGSSRARRPFVTINCAALAETLLESELFGYETRAFTGTVERKPGKLEMAHSGTLFLAEVGELPENLQVALLQVLQTREFTRVGGWTAVRVDVRLIAATHRDLEQSVHNGTFNATLYWHLSDHILTMPPLRDRREDIALLANHFAARVSQELGRRVAGFSPDASACLERYSWPGNVRELRNVVERAVVLGEGELIGPADLPEAILEASMGEGTWLAGYHEAGTEHKKQLVLDALKEAHGDISRAAMALGLYPNHFYLLITDLGLRGVIQN